MPGQKVWLGKLKTNSKCQFVCMCCHSSSGLQWFVCVCVLLFVMHVRLRLALLPLLSVSSTTGITQFSTFTPGTHTNTEEAHSAISVCVDGHFVIASIKCILLRGECTDLS